MSTLLNSLIFLELNNVSPTDGNIVNCEAAEQDNSLLLNSIESSAAVALHGNGGIPVYDIKRGGSVGERILLPVHTLAKVDLGSKTDIRIFAETPEVNFKVCKVRLPLHASSAVDRSNDFDPSETRYHIKLIVVAIKAGNHRFRTESADGKVVFYNLYGCSHDFPEGGMDPRNVTRRKLDLNNLNAAPKEVEQISALPGDRLIFECTEVGPWYICDATSQQLKPRTYLHQRVTNGLKGSEFDHLQLQFAVTIPKFGEAGFGKPMVLVLKHPARDYLKSIFINPQS